MLPTCSFIKKEDQVKVFYCAFSENFKNTYFLGHLVTAAFKISFIGLYKSFVKWFEEFESSVKKYWNNTSFLIKAVLISVL